MHCHQCAHSLPDGSQFCSNCGADAGGPQTTPAAPLDDAGVAKLTRLLREETAGDYEIERELARGGMGVVYLATEIQLRRRVAIKVLPPALTFGQGAIERFRREARTAAALDHPNIIPIHRVSAGGELLWYSMKLLEGRSLDVLLKEREQLAFEETIAILEQVADALDHAHQHGVIHRDIKPGNIVLDDRGRVTVTDFGIAKEIQETSLSTSGHLLGTPDYMSPEQFLGAEVTGAADQYSLGVVAYQCLGRQVPFDAATAYELLSKHASEPPPPLANLRRDLPPYAYAAIDQALSKNPADRFASVSDFVNALAGRALVRVAPRSVPARWGTRTKWGAGIATAAVAVTAWLTLGRGGAEELQPSAADPPPPRPTAPATPEPSTAPRASRPTAAPPAQAPMAVLVIRLTSGWARIYVDGALRGERPVHREQLPPGTHALRFERPGYITLDTTLTLQAGQNVVEIQIRRVSP